LLKKASDPHKALLDYRNTEILDIELSPAQIFFGRRLRTLLPNTAPLLNAHNRQDIRKMLNDEHSKQLEPLENGQTVLIHNEKSGQNMQLFNENITIRSHIYM
jgi:hypothetical protein